MVEEEERRPDPRATGTGTTWPRRRARRPRPAARGSTPSRELRPAGDVRSVTTAHHPINRSIHSAPTSAWPTTPPPLSARTLAGTSPRTGAAVACRPSDRGRGSRAAPTGANCTKKWLSERVRLRTERQAGRPAHCRDHAEDGEVGEPREEHGRNVWIAAAIVAPINRYRVRNRIVAQMHEESTPARLAAFEPISYRSSGLRFTIRSVVRSPITRPTAMATSMPSTNRSRHHRPQRRLGAERDERRGDHHGVEDLARRA